LRQVLGDALDPALTDEQLKTHPLAVWIELQIGLEDGQKLSRRLPITLADAAQTLSDFTGQPSALCRQHIQEMLSIMSKGNDPHPARKP
jgi:hypothetical protein